MEHTGGRENGFTVQGEARRGLEERHPLREAAHLLVGFTSEKTATKYDREPCIKWLCCAAKRQSGAAVQP
jgi:hypothetical protein